MAYSPDKIDYWRQTDLTGRSNLLIYLPSYNSESSCPIEGNENVIAMLDVDDWLEKDTAGHTPFHAAMKNASAVQLIPQHILEQIPPHEWLETRIPPHDQTPFEYFCLHSDLYRFVPSKIFQLASRELYLAMCPHKRSCPLLWLLYRGEIDLVPSAIIDNLTVKEWQEHYSNKLAHTLLIAAIFGDKSGQQLYKIFKIAQDRQTAFKMITLWQSIPSTVSISIPNEVKEKIEAEMRVNWLICTRQKKRRLRQNTPNGK